MITGVKNWNNRDFFYTQENNPSEEILRKAGVKTFLISCGVTSAINILAGMGVLPEIKVGNYTCQPEAIAMDFMNDPKNYAKFKQIRGDVDPAVEYNTTVPQYYSLAMGALFGVDVQFKIGHEWNEVAEHLQKGEGVQLCLKSPSHFVAVVGYDNEKAELIYNDSYGSRFKDGKGGFNRRMTKDEYHTNTKNFCNIYRG